MEIITSKSNENVKFIRSLNERKFREKHSAFCIEGIKVINEIISDKAIDILFIAYCEEILTKINGGNKIIDTIYKLDIKKISVSESVFGFISDTITPQGIIAVVRKPEFSFESLVNKLDTNILILDRIQDSGNLGTIIRTCDAFNIKTVICTNGTADIYSPKVIRSTMGSIFRVNVVYIDEIQQIQRLKDNRIYNSFRCT